VEVTLEGDPWHIGQYLKGIDGHTCKLTPRGTFGNVINVKDSLL
jgi:hypothetical protein